MAIQKNVKEDSMKEIKKIPFLDEQGNEVNLSNKERIEKEKVLISLINEDIKNLFYFLFAGILVLIFNIYVFTSINTTDTTDAFYSYKVSKVEQNLEIKSKTQDEKGNYNVRFTNLASTTISDKDYNIYFGKNNSLKVKAKKVSIYDDYNKQQYEKYFYNYPWKTSEYDVNEQVINQTINKVKDIRKSYEDKTYFPSCYDVKQVILSSYDTNKKIETTKTNIKIDTNDYTAFGKVLSVVNFLLIIILSINLFSDVIRLIKTIRIRNYISYMLKQDLEENKESIDNKENND